MAGGEDLSTKASELVKRVLTVGIGAIFLTEESLRNLFSEFKLPKELLSGLLESAGKTKRDFLQSFSKEIVGRLTDKVDPKVLLQSVLEDLALKHEINIRLSVNLVPKGKAGTKTEDPDLS